MQRHLRGENYGFFQSAAEYTTQQTDTSLVAAPGSGKALYLTDVVIVCNAAVTVTLESGASTTMIRHYGDAQGSGLAHSYHVPLKWTGNEAMTLTTSGAVTVYVGVTGYVGKE